MIPENDPYQMSQNELIETIMEIMQKLNTLHEQHNIALKIIHEVVLKFPETIDLIKPLAKEMERLGL